MTTRLLGAAFAAALFIVASTPAHADIVVLRDGRVLPKKIADEMKPGDVPSFQTLRDSGKNNLTLTYGRCKIGSVEFSAGLIVDVFTTNAGANSDFNDAEMYGASGDFEAAAHKLNLAAQDLEGADRQVALYKRMQGLRALGNVKAMLAAADDLITADPQGYYVPEAHMLRARVFIARGKAKDALGALEAITKTTGMNARDYFEAELAKLDWFELRKAGTDAGKLTKLEKRYRDLARQAGGKGKEAEIQNLKGLVGAGKCLVRMQKYAEAGKTFAQITGDSSVEDKTLLGAAYHGLGDSVYGRAKMDLQQAAGDQGKIDAAKGLLTEAALHYLRVTEFYGSDWAPDNVLDCTMNLARVFANQWSLDGGKDCALGGRAYSYYVKAARAMPRGETRTQLVREALAFKKELDVACPPTAPGR